MTTAEKEKRKDLRNIKEEKSTGHANRLEILNGEKRGFPDPLQQNRTV